MAEQEESDRAPSEENGLCCRLLAFDIIATTKLKTEIITVISLTFVNGV